jgi:membrane protein
LVLSFLVILGPLIFKTAARYVPWLEPLEAHFDIARYGISSLVLALALFIVHMWLPAGRRSLSKVWPGILATLVLWLAMGLIFGHYLADFAYTYVNYYAGLASAMIALVFLYYSAWIFVYCGELNATIIRVREASEIFRPSFRGRAKRGARNP